MGKNINKIIERLLDSFKEERINKEDVISKFKEIYFEDIGFAKIDHHRLLRRDFPEVIYGANKTPEQILEIAKKILNYSSVLLVTRTTIETFKLLKKEIKNIKFNSRSNIIYTPLDIPDDNLSEGITVICAGTSDISVAEEAAITCYLMKNKVRKIYDVGVAGIHRLVSFKDELNRSNVIIAVAGMEGALPGVVSSMVDCPVIGVPTSVGYGTSFKGISPLLTMLNSCSPGVVVVNIDNGFGAGYAAGIINRVTKRGKST
ncbi:MAG: nickel pincer cofactor biosynthesis protein LarB [Actinobacteria bacterium]|nr:nickel pincer cofactor biosynthesis protein LarB [Actinomycetota bacterium]MBU4483098.1 nickel pincer cofactor biosynthesis protein LarB [Actinomycetota bacterium]MCG2790943.1 nickel pincer cofactor biosynthesis protein LarB [Actinomycetes bacterium]